MRIPGRVSSAVRGFATSGALAVGATFFACALAVESTADDVSSQSANSLNITGSTCRGNAAAIGGKRVAERLPCVGVYEPDIWHVAPSRKQYTLSRNNLATSRSWLQVGENWRLNENRSFFGREWFISDDLLSVYVSGG